MASRIVVFLGESDQYKTVIHNYREGGRPRRSSDGYKFPVEAWFAALRDMPGYDPEDPPTVLIVGTQETRRGVDRVKESLRGYAERTPVQFSTGFVEISARDLRGAETDSVVTQEPFWRIFDLFRTLLSPTAIPETTDITLGDKTEPLRRAAQNIVVDITHSFRAFPFLAAAALQMAQAEAYREEPSGALAPQSRYAVLYAQLLSEEEASVWDLSAVLRAQRWNGGIHALLKYGRAEEFAAACAADDEFYDRQLQSVAESGGQETARPVSFKELREAAVEFAANIRFNRTPMILGIHSQSAAQRLIDAINGALPSIRKEIALLEPILHRLQKWAEPLVASTLYSDRGVDAMRYLASLQGEFGLGSNQGSTLRELVLTKAMRQLHLKSLVEPGTAGCGDQRVRAGDYWNDSIYSRQSGPPAVSEEFGPVDSSHKPLAKLTKTIQSARNDVDHCGLKDTPRKAESLAREFANVLSKL